MSNSLFKDFNQTAPTQASPINQFTNLINEFNKFRSTFSGNPEMQVKHLLNTGQLSQEKFNEFASTATMLSKFIK